MKIKYVVCFVPLLLLLVNCSNDNNTSASDQLEGTWALTEKRLEGQNITHGCDLLSTDVFSSNNNYSEKYYTPNARGDCDSYETQGTYTISDNTLIIDYTIPESTQIVIPFTVSSETLIYKNDSGSNAFIFTRADV